MSRLRSGYLRRDFLAVLRFAPRLFVAPLFAAPFFAALPRALDFDAALRAAEALLPAAFVAFRALLAAR